MVKALLKRGWRQRWSLQYYGFSGFIGFEATYSQAITRYSCLCCSFLDPDFKYWKEELKYLSVLGIFSVVGYRAFKL